MVETGQQASTLAKQFETVPQLLKNVRYAAGSEPLAAESVQSTIAKNEERLGDEGRILIRKSGTEPLVRVMAECEDSVLLNDVVDTIVDAVEKAGT